MAAELRVFISHSAGDAALVEKLLPLLKAGLLAVNPRAQVMVDVEGLRAGRPWKLDIHRWMVRCNAALVLLTPKVLAKSAWVAKEAGFFSVRADVNSSFRLWYARASLDEVSDAQLNAAGFGPVAIKEQQLLKTELSEDTLPTLVQELCASLPALPTVTENEDVLEMVEGLLCQDAAKGLCRLMADRLGVSYPGTWVPDEAEAIGALTAYAAVTQRQERKVAIATLLEKLPWLVPEHEKPFLHLLAPLWVGRAAAQQLRDEAPDALTGKGGGTVLIAGKRVLKFTGEMYVRRAYGADRKFKITGVSRPAGGDLFAEISRSLCAWARHEGWVEGVEDAEVIEELKAHPLPVFVPLGFWPDPSTCAALREAFPRFVFIASRTGAPTGVTGDGGADAGADGSAAFAGVVQIASDPPDEAQYLQLEADEFNGWYSLT